MESGEVEEPESAIIQKISLTIWANQNATADRLLKNVYQLLSLALISSYQL